MTAPLDPPQDSLSETLARLREAKYPLFVEDLTLALDALAQAKRDAAEADHHNEEAQEQRAQAERELETLREDKRGWVKMAAAESQRAKRAEAELVAMRRERDDWAKQGAEFAARTIEAETELAAVRQEADTLREALAALVWALDGIGAESTHPLHAATAQARAALAGGTAAPPGYPEGFVLSKELGAVDMRDYPDAGGTADE